MGLIRMNEKVAVTELTQPGYLQIYGEDRHAFLQRQTTNDIHLLGPNRVLLTVLTTPNARILDVFQLFEEEDFTGVVTLPNQVAATANFLKSRIFFMDKVKLKNASREYAQIDLFGSEAGTVLKQSGVTALPAVDEVILAELSGKGIRILRMHPAIGLGFRLLVDKNDKGSVLDLFKAMGIDPVDERGYRLFHIEAGIPFAGAELSEAYTPLETRLEAAISQNKGCYTGQEVISRQITYGKVTQRLCGIRLDAKVEPGSRLWAGEKSTGVITSSAFSPRFGWIGLGMLKRPYDRVGIRLEAEAEGGERRAAQIADLPFSQVS